MSASKKVLILAIRVQLWSLFQNQQLFRAKDEDGRDSSTYHLAEMVALLGEPSAEYVTRSTTARRFFDTSGRWIGGASSMKLNLESLEDRSNNKDAFVLFMRKILKWDPEERQSARELLNDPWLEYKPRA